MLGVQIWQVLFVLLAPLATNAPSIQQPSWHISELHTLPDPQGVPLTAPVHAVVIAQILLNEHVVPAMQPAVVAMSQL